MPTLEALLASVPGQPLQGLRQADLRLHQLRHSTTVPAAVVQADTAPLAPDWDVLICGGTLGILIGAALAKLGWRVAVIERGKLQGRRQEWNISRSELGVLVNLALLTPAELEQAIASEFNPVRVSFLGSPDLWVKDVLNLGVDPVYLLDILKQRFIESGGTLLEHTQFQGVTVSKDGVAVTVKDPVGASQVYTGRLLLDAMGHSSPLVAQARGGQAPDSLCLVVGTCAQGMPANNTADLMVSFTPLQRHCQYFWEAFPARDGRTTYLFTYSHPQAAQAPTLTELFTDYFQLLGDYQQVNLEQLQIQRALFGVFPSYRHSPLRPSWNRILAIGDSSGQQSPLSFGGFGSMLRHLERLQTGLDLALKADCLDQSHLALLQPYQPNLSVTWLFQQAMTLRPQQTLAPNQINQLLGTVFQTMAQLGEGVLIPFLQDNVQFLPLTQTLGLTGVLHPGLVAKIIAQVGPGALLAWLPHYLNLGVYSGLHHLLSPRSIVQTLANPKNNKNINGDLGVDLESSQALIAKAQNPEMAQTYIWQQRLAAWAYGSGADSASTSHQTGAHLGGQSNSALKNNLKNF
jgi:lycopene cyclase CruP